MTTTREEIEKYKREHQPTYLRYDLVDDDAIMRGGRYDGMLLSDIFIVFPGYVDFIIDYPHTDEGLKLIAKEIKERYHMYEDSIRREISLFG